MPVQPRWLLLLACLAAPGGTPVRAQPPPAGAHGDQGGSRTGRADRPGDPLPPRAVLRLGAVQDDAVNPCLAFSPDGRTLASGGDGGVRLWDVATGKERDRFPVSLGIYAAQFSPDGRTLVTGDGFGRVHRRDLTAGAVTGPPPLTGRTRFANPAGFFSADGRLFGIAEGSGDAWLWDVASGRQVLHRKESGGAVSGWSALSPDGQILAVGGGNHRVLLIDTATGREIRRVEGPRRDPRALAGFGLPPGWVTAFTFSPDGRLLAAVVMDSVCVWDVTSGALRYQIPGTYGRLAFSPGGKYLACGQYAPIRLYDAADGTEVRRFEPHDGEVRALAFSPDGTRLASAQRHAVNLWDVATGKRLHPRAGHESPVSCLAFSPDGKTLASGASEDGTVLVWDLASGLPRHALPGHVPAACSVAYSPDGTRLAVGAGFPPPIVAAQDAHIRLWDPDGGRLLRDIPAHLTNVQSVAFAPDGRTLVSAGGDARAKLWDVATGRRLHQLRGADSRLRSAGFAPDGKAVLVAGEEGELNLWSAATGEVLRDLRPSANPRRPVAYGAFLPGGATVPSVELVPDPKDPSRRGAEARFWDRGDGRLLRSWPVGELQGSDGRVALAPDGKTLAVTGASYFDPVVRLWDTASGKLVARLVGHRGGAATALAFSPDGTRLATGGRDTTVLVWDVRRARLDHLLAELAAASSEAARALAKRPPPGDLVPLLHDRLRRAAEVGRRVAGLVAELDDDQFAVRERATHDLEGLGPVAVPALRQVLEGSPSPEARRWLEKVVGRLTGPAAGRPGVDPREVGLAVAALEEVGTAEARQALRELARGPADAPVTREARAALARLGKRPQPP